MAVSLDDLARGVAAAERPALARALSLAERDSVAAAGLLARLAHRLGRAHVVGVTGPPGAGKSTLVGVMVRHFLEHGQRVAVLAVDPSSPVSGGALLGDRFRIGEGAADNRSFIRSTATRGSLGGLTAAARQMVQLMDAAGYDLVLVETVGTGQSEIDVAQLADSLLVVFPPGLGDELQAIKAGILELADLLVVTKSDTAAAAQAAQSLRTAAHMWRKAPPIHAVSAFNGEGIAALAEAILSRARATPPAAWPVEAETAAPLALRESFEKLWNELDRRLPFHPAAGLYTELSGAETAADPSALQVVVGVRPGGTSFQLGAAAGALAVLAADMDLHCHIDDIDLAAATLRFRLLPAGAMAESTA
ncbi:MAG: methylmalonyl Co-A mutase-associated GTPase MeaB [Sulfuritalea sp.]|nr:methylmalonyl Co-A mutase-associated GTPase MeaB [Sulfuritalea sp.]MDP1982851.1 methylmalonyl Co-A mutase-associated GTPase MeaB [Sulfuritalea sp.]